MDEERIFLQSLSMLVILGSAIIGVWLAIKKSSKISCLWPLVGIPSYFLYESTIPSHANIRADLILIYPLLFVAVVSVIICSQKQLNRRPEKIVEQSQKMWEEYFGEKMSSGKLEDIRKKVSNYQANGKECILMLGLMGYEATEKQGKWVVLEPMGGKVELIDVRALNEYTIGKV